MWCDYPVHDRWRAKHRPRSQEHAEGQKHN